MDWSCQEAKLARWLHVGQVETFFDDTAAEVQGHKFEAARINYDGNRALSWQTLWFGPWMLDGILDGATDVSEHERLVYDTLGNEETSITSIHHPSPAQPPGALSGPSARAE